MNRVKRVTAHDLNIARKTLRRCGQWRLVIMFPWAILVIAVPIWNMIHDSGWLTIPFAAVVSAAFLCALADLIGHGKHHNRVRRQLLLLEARRKLQGPPTLDARIAEDPLTFIRRSKGSVFVNHGREGA